MPRWAEFRPPETFRRIGGEWHGPCPVTGEGRDGFYINAERELMGCRKCCPGNGRLDGEAFKAHAVALGIWATNGDGWQPTAEQRRRFAERKRAEAATRAAVDRMMLATSPYAAAPARVRPVRSVTMRWSLEGQCPDCHGTGYERCATCGGLNGAECRDCGSLGRMWCRRCGGGGWSR